jgi:hypothetical protein
MTDDAIVPTDVRALEAIYFSAMLDALKVYDVADRLLELSLAGRLPVGVSGAREVLERYRQGASERLSKAERLSVYARALGVPGGDAGGSPNTDFNDLWMRFVSSVSALARQHAADIVQGATTPEDVRTAGRDLAFNMSRHGAGLHAVATAINTQRVEALSVLAQPDIHRAYGVRGVWQLVERVSSLELGGPMTDAHYVAMAESGSVVFAWLASRSPAFWTAVGSAFDFGERHADRPATNPTDFDLFNACEQWLAAAGGGDSRVENPSQPVQTVAVREAVGALLSRSAAFGSLSPAVQARVAGDMTHIADYLAAREGTAAFASFVDEVDFPAFVTDLIGSVFDAVVDASVRQMEAYADLIAAVAASVDEFRDERVTDVQARERLCERFPALCEGTSTVGRSPASRAPAVAGPTRGRVTTRQQLLATMVATGVRRIAVSG